MGSAWLLASSEVYAIPLGAFIISAASLIYVAVGARRSSASDYEHTLKERVDDLERRLDACQQQRDTLERENIHLMRELFQIKNGSA